MTDTVDTAIYKLSYDTGTSVQQLNQTRTAAEGLVATTEKVDRATRTTSAGFDRLIGKYDASARATQNYERQLSQVARYEAEGIGTAAQHATIREKVTAAYQAETLAARTAAGQMTATERAAASLAVVTQDLQGRMQATAGQSGILGQALATLGPVGAGIALGFGAAVITFYAMSEAAHHLAEKATELRNFAASTGLTTLQVQALRSEASKVGVSSESLEGSLTKMTIAFEGVRNESGGALDVIRRYRPELVEQLKATDDVAESITLLSKAFVGLTTAQQNALARPIVGRNVEIVRLLATGVDVGKIAAAYKDAGKALDEGLIDRLPILQQQVEKASHKAQEGIASIFSEDVLRLQLSYYKTLEAIVAKMKAFPQGNAFPMEFLFTGSGLPSADTPTAPLKNRFTQGNNVPETTEADVTQKAIETQQSKVKVLERTVQALGAAATETEKYTLGVAQLDLKLKEGTISQETFNRAVAALDTNAKIMAGLADQLTVAQAVTGFQKQIATEQSRYNELVREGVSEEHASARASAERAISVAQVNSSAKLQLASLADQLTIAKALTGAAKQRAEAEAATNALLREGVDAGLAQAVGAAQLQIAREQANRSIEEQTRSLNQQTALIKAQQDGNEANVAAAQAYSNAIRQGADATQAAALAAATLSSYLAKADIEAAKLESSMEGASRASFSSGGGGGAYPATSSSTAQGELGTSHGGTTIGASISMGSIDWNKIDPLHSYGDLGRLNFTSAQGIASLAAMMPLGQLSYLPGQLEGYYSQQYSTYDPATLQKLYNQSSVYQDTSTPEGAALQGALQTQYQTQDPKLANDIAKAIIAGTAPLTVLAQVISKSIGAYASPNARFQAELDLEKRAGVEQTQILADIKSGKIGAGADPTVLLQAMDALTEAIKSNTDAISLSPFYTQQGDHLLGYRGYSNDGVGIAAVPTATSTTGTTTTGTTTTANQPVVSGAGGGLGPSTYGDPTQTATNNLSQDMMKLYRHPAYATGGIAYSPQTASIAENMPEAVVPLAGGSIPVKIVGRAGNDNNQAPIYITQNFFAAADRDDIRQTSYQAISEARRAVFGAR